MMKRIAGIVITLGLLTCVFIGTSALAADPGGWPPGGGISELGK